LLLAILSQVFGRNAESACENVFVKASRAPVPHCRTRLCDACCLAATPACEGFARYT
jgi:hypothetical protein